MPKTKSTSDEILSKIDDVLISVRGFAFEPALLKEADKLVKWAATQKRSLSKHRAISLAVEIYNEYGYSNKSKTTIHRFAAELENVFAEISTIKFDDSSAAEIEEYKKHLEQVCWVYAGAAITHYWYHESREGLEWIRKANDIIQRYLIPEHKGKARDCSGIRARLSYYEALLYLQLNDAKRAEVASNMALELADARLTLIAKKHENQNDYWGTPEGLRESRYTNMCLAKILGFAKARIRLLQGELQESAFLLETAEVVLRQSKSPTMARMIRLWLFKVRRALAGRDIEKLNTIIPELRKCYEEFSGDVKTAKPAQQNRFYASVAAFEVSLASLYKAQGIRHQILEQSEETKASDETNLREAKQKELEESEEYKEAYETARFYLTKVGTKQYSQDEEWPFSQDLNDYWEFSRALLESRIDRERDDDAPKAKENAERALAIAQNVNRPDLTADAYITLGEALLKLKKPREALNKFMEAERENEKDQNKSLAKIKAVCCLRKAEAYVGLKKKYEAIRMLNEWELLKEKIEPQVIHFIANKVQKQLKGVIGDFVIGQDEPNLNLKVHSKNLEIWLTNLVIGRKKKTERERLDPKWLQDTLKVSLSKAYNLIRESEPDWKGKKTAAANKAGNKTT